jgi:hypothetical protein
MGLNLSSILPVLKNGLTVAETFLPAAGMFGGPVIAGAVKLVEGLVDVASNVSERVSEGEVVASSSDQSELQGIIQRLQTVNDQLAAKIDAS